MDKLEKINEAVNEIREILNVECASIEDLPNMVRQLAEDPSRGGFTTSFIFSSNVNNPTPSECVLNSDGLVEGLDGSGWFQTEPLLKESRMLKSVDNSDEKILMSFAIFGPSGDQRTEWSSPVNLKGNKGDTGIKGDQGEQGEPGEKGPQGVNANSYRTVFVYKTTDNSYNPGTPEGGYWDIVTNEFFPPTGWVSNADDVEDKKYLWLSQAVFDESGDLINTWCEPFRMTGEDGKNGTDGRNIEFIYRQVQNIEVYNTLKRYIDSNGLPNDKKRDDYIPEPNPSDPLNIGTKWTDSPSGINEIYQIEVVCSRVRKSTNEDWGDWSPCVIWSKWGEDGTDGDGVEYIYLVTPSKDGDTKVTSEYVEIYKMPSRYEALLNSRYQEDEFCFNSDFGYDGYFWTDEPSDVGPNEPMEWVSSRKQINGKWGEFSSPKLWATYSSDGDSYFTSFVFTRAAISNPPARPTGGSFENPKPYDVIWHDSIPYDSNNLPVWMSNRTFKSDDENYQNQWSDPKILSDTNDFQVEYCASETISPLSKFTGNETEWRNKQAETWGDDTMIKDPIWMATASCKNGEWSNWVVTRIKGEKGDVGENGTSVSIKSKVQTKQELLDAWGDYIETGKFLPSDPILDPGDGCFVDDEGLLYIYSGGYSDEEDNAKFETYWTSIEIKGEPGDSSYIYTAYTDTLNADVPIDITPGNAKKYIGFFYTNKIHSSEQLKNYDLYTWQKWSGEDGWGYEQIFLLTHKDLPYTPNGFHCPLPNREEGDNEPEYLPRHPFGQGALPHVDANAHSQNNRWSDTPMSPDETYPYCWVATRKINSDGAGPWKGDRRIVDGQEVYSASLYSRYTTDGVSGVYVELSNDFAYIPTENNKIDPDFIKGINENTIDKVKTVVRAYIGDEPVRESQIKVEGEHIIVEGISVYLKLDEITPEITEIPLHITVGDRVYEKSWKLFYSDTGYIINPDSIVIKRDSYSGILNDDELKVEITKWSGKDFVATTVPLFANVYYDNKPDPTLLTVADGTMPPTTGGIVRIDLTQLEPWVSKIRLFITEASDDGLCYPDSKKLAYQDIGIVFDGKGTHAINLTNDMGTIPLESDGSIDPEAPVISTKIQMLEGNEEVNASYKVEPNNNAITISGNVVSIYPSRFESAKVVPNEIKCYATYRDITLYKTFKLNTSRNAFEIFTDSETLHRDPYNGRLLDGDIVCNIRKWNTDKNVYEVPSDVTSLYVIIDCTHVDEADCNYEIKGHPDSSGNITLDLSEEINLKSFRIYLTKEDTLVKAKASYLTYEDIVVVADGQKGESALHLELSNDFTMIPTDSNGNPNTNWDEEPDAGQDLAISTASLYLGWNLVNGSYSWEIVDGVGTLEDAKTATCSLITMTTDSVTIRCTATYDGQSIFKDFNVVKSKGAPVYKLVPSAQLFTFDKNGNASPSNITFTINKWDGFKFNTITSENNLSLSASSISPKKADQIVYLKYNDVVVDQETIGWVEDGADGQDGAGVEYIFARGTVDTTNWSSAGISAPNDSWAYDNPVSPWYDESKGVDSTNVIEWVSSRRKAQGSNNWTNWSTPVVWARYSKDGADGRGITGIEERYLASKDKTGVTVNTSGWSANVQTPTKDLPYLWNYEIINYTSGEPTKTTPAIIGMYGAVGEKGDTGRGISNIEERYQLTTTNSQPSSNSFDNASKIPLIPDSTERYLWNREVVSYTDGTATESITLLCVYGEKGNPGDKGDSVTITSTKISYAQGSNGKDVPSESSWKDDLIEVPKGYYLWTRTVVNYSDGNSTTTYSSAYSGTNGQNGANGSDGKDAPATPFAGEWDSTKSYYGNSRRTDIVRYAGDGKYYVANQTHPGNDPFVDKKPSGKGTDNEYWLAFGNSFDNVATGFIAAEQGHIEGLTVNAVKTYDPNTSQYIVIDDGTMTVYDKKENGNIKLSITGDKLGNIPDSSNGNFEWNPFVETSFSSDNIEDICVEQEFTFTTTASPAIIQLDPKMTRNLWAWGEGGYSAMSDVVTLMSIYIDDEFKTEIDITDFGIPESDTIPSTGLKLQEKTVNLLDAHQSSFNFAVNSAGNHVLKVLLQIQWMDNGSQGAFFTYKDTVSGSYTITYPMNRIAMGSNGLNVVFQDSSNKVQFISDSDGNLSDLTLESTNYGIQVLPNGLKMKLNGTWYTASRDANGFLKLT